jgi:hypothetical protein
MAFLRLIATLSPSLSDMIFVEAESHNVTAAQPFLLPYEFDGEMPMKGMKSLLLPALASALATASGAPAWALNGIQIGPSGKTYASAAPQCAMNPTTGMAPMVMAGL